MPEIATKESHPFRAGAAFSVSLSLLAFFLPFLGMSLPGAWLTNLLFFSPQLLFPYGHLSRHGSTTYLFDSSTGLLLNVLQWGIVGLGFAWCTRRLTMAWQILATVAVVAGTGVLVCAILSIGGVEVSLDGF